MKKSNRYFYNSINRYNIHYIGKTTHIKLLSVYLFFPQLTNVKIFRISFT